MSGEDRFNTPVVDSAALQAHIKQQQEPTSDDMEQLRRTMLSMASSSRWAAVEAAFRLGFCLGRNNGEDSRNAGD